MNEDEDFGFIEKIRFPDGVYCKAEAYAHTFDRNGEIGEVRIYQSSLSATEVSQNFNATKSKYGL